MAEGKKSFLLYTDLYFTVQKLTDEKAGELFKHILAYVNDKNPDTDDLILQIAFEPIKQSLKRDLKKYEGICLRNKENGAKGGRPKNKKPKKPSRLINNPKNPDEPKKPDNDIDSDNDIEKDNEEYISLPFSESFNLWLKYKTQRKENYKSALSKKTCYNNLVKLSNNNPDIAKKIVEQSMANNWAGLFPIKVQPKDMMP